MKITHTFKAQADDDAICTCGKPRAYHPTQDELDQRQAEDIVNAQPLETIEAAKAFAKAWIVTAAQHARNEEHYRLERDAVMRALSKHDNRSWCAVCGFDNKVCDERWAPPGCLGSHARKEFPREEATRPGPAADPDDRFVRGAQGPERRQ